MNGIWKTVIMWYNFGSVNLFDLLIYLQYVFASIRFLVFIVHFFKLELFLFVSNTATINTFLLQKTVETQDSQYL